MTSQRIIIIKGLIIVCHGLLTHAGLKRFLKNFNFPTSVYVVYTSLIYWSFPGHTSFKIRPKINLQFALRSEK